MSGFRFNDLLKEAGVPLDRTKLIRHSDNRGAKGKSPYDLWLAKDGSLEKYQQLQANEVFDVGDWLAVFVATPYRETLFVGMYRVVGVGRASEGTIDPLLEIDAGGKFEYQIEQMAPLSEYLGRVVIEWGGGYINWRQLAKNQDKEIIELRRLSAIDTVFPGYQRFTRSVKSLVTIPVQWQAALEAVRGVYILTSLVDGKQYVGSASGERGFWGRWEDYAKNGHGGNVDMVPVASDDFQISILEVAASTASADEIRELESLWKERLMTKIFGLNKN
ncbi:MAG: GIY-YIG nuclease family protein [Janthinobacterium lividum]